MTRDRRTELFIVVTVYNEDGSLFIRIMQGVMKNIAYLCMPDRSKTWGEVGWKTVVVHIVSDCLRMIVSRTLSVVVAKRTYQGAIMTNVVHGKHVVAHIYEYTTQTTSHDACFLSCFTPSAVSVTLSNKIKD